VQVSAEEVKRFDEAEAALSRGSLPPPRPSASAAQSVDKLVAKTLQSQLSRRMAELQALVVAAAGVMEAQRGALTGAGVAAEELAGGEAWDKVMRAAAELQRTVTDTT
jgi:hypothetical protein